MIVYPLEPLLAQPCGLGALAQLGERRLCKPEVTGSIPVRSIAGWSPAFGAHRWCAGYGPMLSEHERPESRPSHRESTRRARR